MIHLVSWSGLTVPATQNQKSAATAVSGPIASSVGRLGRPAYPLPMLRFSGIHNDFGVDLRQRSLINGPTVAQVLRALALRDIVKGKEEGTLKLTLGQTSLDDFGGFALSDPSALADVMTLIRRPVDVIIKSICYPDGFRAVMNATGKRFMYPDAKLQTGPIEYGIPDSKNREFQVNRRLYNNYIRDLETLVLEKTGLPEKDRPKVFQDLDGTKDFSSLEALYYGKKGLIDAVIVGPETVITRTDLQKYLKAHMKPDEPDKIDEFLRYGGNARKVAQAFSTPLQKFSPETLASADYSHYQSLKSYDRRQRLESHPDSKGRKPLFHFFDRNALDSSQGNIKQVDGITKITNLPLQAIINDLPAFSRIMVENVSANANGILDDDVIFYNDPFMDSAAEQISRALLELHDKKTAQEKRKPGRASHIKLVVNSPGGETPSGREIRNTLKEDLKDTPVDVIVTGMAASCGAQLLSSATGYRFATPLSRMMIHDAAWSARSHGRLLNQMGDSLQQDTLDYFDLIAEATGRPLDDIAQDALNDLWLNPLEALFYGPKGLIDAILVSPTEVLTRRDIEKYLAKRHPKQFKTCAAIAGYADRHFLERRSLQYRMKMKPEDLGAPQTDDPFSNPAAVIRDAARQLREEGQTLQISRRFKGTMPPKVSRTIDYYNILCKDLEGYYSEGKKKS